MKKLYQILIGIFTLVLVTSANAANPMQQASDIVKLQAACVSAWEKIDQKIPEYGAFSPTPWPNAADKAKFVDFERAFKLSYTKTGARDFDLMADDALLVASECTKMHNLIVNAHFNRQTGDLPRWLNRISVSEMLQLLMMDE